MENSFGYCAGHSTGFCFFVYRLAQSDTGQEIQIKFQYLEVAELYFGGL
jgi:hypothetical protein